MRNKKHNHLLALFCLCLFVQTAFAQLQKPLNLTVTNSTCTTVTLSWTPVPNATGYNISENHEYRQTVYGTSVTLSYSPSETGNTYSYKLTAYDDSDPEDVSYSPVSDLAFGTLCTPNEGPFFEVNQLPSAVTGNYSMVFEDNFSGGAIDASKWETEMRWGDDIIINNEDQYYVDQLDEGSVDWDPFSFENNKLRIKGDHKPAGYENFFPEQEYFSGVLTSVQNFTYGYYEVRAKLPEGKGLWPAFWLLNSFEGNPPVREIDIMEFVGGDKTAIFNNYHYSVLQENNPNNTNDQNWDPDRCHKVNTRQIRPDDYTATYHTFGVEWTPDYIAWFIDGELQKVVIDEDCNGQNNSQELNNLVDNYSGSYVSDQTMYILLNLAIGQTSLGTEGDGAPNSETTFPAYFDIDYVRVYQKSNTPNTNAGNSISWNQTPTTIVDGDNDITVNYNIDQDGLVLLQLFNEDWGFIGQEPYPVSAGSGQATVTLTPNQTPTETNYIQAKLLKSNWGTLNVPHASATVSFGETEIENSLEWNPKPTSISAGNNSITVDYSIDEDGLVIIQLFNDVWGQIANVPYSVSAGSGQVTIQVTPDSPPTTTTYLQAKLRAANWSEIGVPDLNETITAGTNTLTWSPEPTNIYTGNNVITLNYNIDQNGLVVLQLFDDVWEQISDEDVSVSAGSGQVTLTLPVNSNSSATHFLQAKLLANNWSNIIPPNQLTFNGISSRSNSEEDFKYIDGFNIYPNPFNDSFSLEYASMEEDVVTIELFNQYASRVKVIESNTLQPAGQYRKSIDASDLQTGIYFVKITTKKGSEVRKVLKY